MQTIVQVVSKWSKPQLANWLADHGTIYPDRKGLARWSKNELVNSVLDRMGELHGQAVTR